MYNNKQIRHKNLRDICKFSRNENSQFRNFPREKTLHQTNTELFAQKHEQEFPKEHKWHWSHEGSRPSSSSHQLNYVIPIYTV